MELTTRNASLKDLAEILREQHSRKLDIVAPASAIKSEGAQLVIAGADPVVDETGVAQADGRYRVMESCEDGIAGKLQIPGSYMRRMRETVPELYDANVNGWLARDDRSFLVRCLTGDTPGTGVARAFLSDRFGIIDNLDVLTAALDGVRQSGAEVEVQGCDLTERRMYVRVACPQVEALAPGLLERYRSPFNGNSGKDLPVVFAGFVISNSETGGAAFTITPRLTVKVCENGLTITKDALRQVHLGGRLEQGVIRWSHETQQRQLALVTSQAQDAVRTFLDVEYVQRTIAGLEELATTPVNDVQVTIKTLSNKLKFSEEQQAGVLDHFIRGGDVTAGGIMQAITSYAQTVENADEAFTLEGQALSALELVGAR